MAAELKIYSDAGCTTELTGNPYSLDLGTYNGTAGETKTTSIWVKNTGTVTISAVTLTETLDTDTRGSYSLDDNTYNNTTITLGDMTTTTAIRVYVKVTVGSSTAVHVAEPLNFTVSGTYTT